jgi:hypothetical protein
MGYHPKKVVYNLNVKQSRFNLLDLSPDLAVINIDQLPLKSLLYEHIT